jgi:hypothetical protein
VPFQLLELRSSFKLSCFVEFNCILSFGISTTIDLMVDEKKIIDPALSGFYEAMEKTNADKIANEMLARISKHTSDSESFNMESGNEDAESCLWKINY